MHGMRQEIVENPTFLRYHEIWRVNPSSVVFAPLAEILILYKCYEEAITVCKKGLEKNPDLVSGRIALARAYMGVSNYRRASEEAHWVLDRYPGHPEAVEILTISEKHIRKDEEEKGHFARPSERHEDEFLPSSLDPTSDARWNTVTMAGIYASQGDITTARKIYHKVLDKEPGNILAREGLVKLDEIQRGTL